jgi:hypothetical protein
VLVLSRARSEGINLLRISESMMKEGSAQGVRAFEWAGAFLLDACTVDASYGHLLVLTAQGSLHGVNLDTQASTLLCTVSLPDIPLDAGNNHFGVPRHRLCASQDGKHAAIVVDSGQSGIVVKTQSGAVTMQLNGGDYYEETVPFSACFLRFGGRDVLVHRTAWNRLDAADPTTGEALTSRHIAPYESGGAKPAHHLDYFHGQLRPSPDGRMIFDDGWVWHPISVPRVWSVTQWLATNPWESEDGESIVDLGMRDDWTQPACWINEKQLAMWGAANWDQEEFEEMKRGPGVRVLDMTTREPSAEWWPMAETESVLDLFSDGARLYLPTASRTTAWDVASRAQLDEYPGFTARLLDRSRKTLVAFGSDTIQEIALPR